MQRLKIGFVFRVGRFTVVGSSRPQTPDQGAGGRSHDPKIGLHPNILAGRGEAIGRGGVLGEYYRSGDGIYGVRISIVVSVVKNKGSQDRRQLPLFRCFGLL